MTKKSNNRLGKGVEALLGDIDMNKLRKPVGYINKDIVGTTVKSRNSADILRVPINMIEANPFQPRMSFDQEALEELAESIRSFGLIQPITVRRLDGNKYQIISGERRFRACKLTGMDMIPAYVKEADDQGMLEMAIVENVQRENLDPIEVAMSYQRLIDECNLTQMSLAERVGKKRASVANYLRLLKLPAKVQHDLKVELLTVGHAKVLLSLDDETMQEELCDEVIKKDLSVRQLEDRIRKIKNKDKKKEPVKQDLPEVYYQVLEHMGRYFSDDISLKRNNNGKGTMTVRFKSDEEMENFLQALNDADF